MDEWCMCCGAKRVNGTWVEKHLSILCYDKSDEERVIGPHPPPWIKQAREHADGAPATHE